ncbi:MAG: CAP domain-containing protein [Planctomycetota bacterium]
MKKSFSLFILYLITYGLLGCETTAYTEKGNNLGVEVEHQLFELVNDYRTSQGLSKLSPSDVIRDVARDHSRSMAQREIPVGHSDSENRSAKIRTQIDFRKFAENVAWKRTDTDPSQKIFDSWKENTYNKRSLIGDFDLSGIGVVISEDGDYFATQIFIKKF